MRRVKCWAHCPAGCGRIPPFNLDFIFSLSSLNAARSASAQARSFMGGDEGRPYGGWWCADNNRGSHMDAFHPKRIKGIPCLFSSLSPFFFPCIFLDFLFVSVPEKEEEEEEHTAASGVVVVVRVRPVGVNI